MKYWYLIPLAIVALILVLVGFSTEWDLLYLGGTLGAIIIGGMFYYLLGSGRYGKNSSSDIPVVFSN